METDDMNEDADALAPIGWHYDLDEYVQVQLAPSEEEERKLLINVISLRDKEMQDISSDAHKHIMLFAIRQTLFWATLAEKVQHCGYSMVSPYAMATEIFELGSGFNRETLLRGFGVRAERVSRAASEGGLLLSAPVHQRTLQMANVDLAIHSLLSVDIEDVFDIVGFARSAMWAVDQRARWRDDRRRCGNLIKLLMHATLPLAFSTLWIWKCHLRSLRQWTRDENECIGLWRSCVKLYAMCPLQEEGDDQVAPIDLPGVFSGNVSGTADMVLDTPILSQTLNELWITWSVVTWRTPGLIVGTDFYRCVRLLMFRVAFFVSFSDTVHVFDFPKYVRLPDVNLHRDVSRADELMLTVNDNFLKDTERIFFYLLEACFTSRYLEPGSDAPRATDEQREAWRAVVSNCFSSQTASFVQKQLEKHGWHRYVYWDEIERFQRYIHSAVAMPRKVLGDFRQSHCDAVYEVLRGKNSLEILWRSSRENFDRDMEARREEVGPGDRALSRGWSCRIAWDIRAETEKLHGEGNPDLPQDVEEIYDEASGESTYIYKRNKKRVRGDYLTRIKMARSQRLSSAGVVVKNLLEEIALKVVLQMRQASGDSEAPVAVFGTYKKANHLTLMHLLSHGTQPPHKIQRNLLGEFPIMLSHYNRFYIFDGEVNYASSDNLLDALYAWSLSCERVVRRKLDDILEGLDPESSAEANEQLLRQAEWAVQRVPTVLRRLFDLVRDELAMQPDPVRYRIPHSVRMQDCAWDRANVARFFVRNHPGLNVSRAFTAAGRHVNPASSDGRSQSLRSNDSESLSDEVVDGEMRGVIGDEAGEEEEEDDSDDLIDVISALGGIEW